MRPIFRASLCATAAFTLLVALPAIAFAYNETTATLVTSPTDYATCRCHYPGPSYSFTVGPGPHGGYLATTTKCAACHDVHAAAPGGEQLLPGATIKATCMTCHDGTQGRGVYGTLSKRGVGVGAQHRCETTNVVPGGDPVNGGNATMVFGGKNGDGTLSCDDCHSPHAASCVDTFTADRRRYAGWDRTGYKTNNLLRQRPGDSASSTTVYGSDWCGACHKGRLSGSGMPNNHPVESKLTTTNPNYYERLAVLASDAPTSVVTTGTLGQSNRGYLMPFPRVGPQRNHGPICQQCHEDSRSVGTLDATGTIGDAATYSSTGAGIDGTTVTVGPPPTFDNPRFQNFPHETVNRRFLVETDDDLCFNNCHPLTQLP